MQQNLLTASVRQWETNRVLLAHPNTAEAWRHCKAASKEGVTAGPFSSNSSTGLGRPLPGITGSKTRIFPKCGTPAKRGLSLGTGTYKAAWGLLESQWNPKGLKFLAFARIPRALRMPESWGIPGCGWILHGQGHLGCQGAAGSAGRSAPAAAHPSSPGQRSRGYIKRKMH